MLKKINPNGVISDDGFSIQIIGPELFEYKRGKKTIIFDLAYNSSKQKIYIYVSKEKNLDEAERKNISEDIKKAVELLEGKFEVI